MGFVFALVGAMSLAAVPLALGWRRGVSQAAMARAFGIDQPDDGGLDLEAWAKQTGTGLTFRQIAFSTGAWTLGGAVVGWVTGGWFQALLMGAAGALFYASGMSSKRQEFRIQQAKDVSRAIGVMQTLIGQGSSTADALAQAAESAGPAGKPVLKDLVQRWRSVSPDRRADAVREWTAQWSNPAEDMLATALIAGLENRIEIGDLISSLQRTLVQVIEVLSRAQAEARGIEWQAKFLALEPPLVLVLIRFIAPEIGKAWTNPLFILPVLLGSSISYLLSMRQIRAGLSMEASIGLTKGGEGEIPTDRFGQPL